MKIRTESGWHTDENNNRWDANYYTAEQAEAFSKTLRNCRSCSNCRYCTDCSHCTDCTDCSYCRSCSNCRSCRDCSCCTDCRGCSCCRDCSHCTDCCDCSYCHSFGENPQCIFGWKMGSRGDIPAVYWMEPGKEQCVVGCFRGTLDELEAKVKETHANNPEHLENYLKFIRKVRAYQEM